MAAAMLKVQKDGIGVAGDEDRQGLDRAGDVEGHRAARRRRRPDGDGGGIGNRSEEHTSELQSR